MSNPEEGEPRQAAEPQAAPHDVDFQHTYERLAGAPLRVERIMLVGLQRTKSGVVEQELARIKDARTLEEIRDAALRAYEELMALDIFDAVDVVLGEGSKVCSAGQRSVAPVSFAGLTAWQHLPQRLQGDNLWESPTGCRRQPAAASLPTTSRLPRPLQGGKTCTVVARFQEKNMVRLHAGTYVQGTEGAAIMLLCCCRHVFVCSIWQQPALSLCPAGRDGWASTLLVVSSSCSPSHASLSPTPALPPGSMDTSLNLTNPLGYAEQVSLGAEYGSQSTSIYRVGLTKPKAFGRPLLADVRLHQLAHDFSRWSSYAELLRGGALTLSRLGGCASAALAAG
jgi:hypothetical protein